MKSGCDMGIWPMCSTEWFLNFAALFFFKAMKLTTDCFPTSAKKYVLGTIFSLVDYRRHVSLARVRSCHVLSYRNASAPRYKYDVIWVSVMALVT